MLGAKDVAASIKVYDTAFAPLGIKNLGPFGDALTLHEKDKPAFAVAIPGNGKASTSTT